LLCHFGFLHRFAGFFFDGFPPQFALFGEQAAVNNSEGIVGFVI
jgi:hypothetical protein